jgi:hypothetical protein
MPYFAEAIHGVLHPISVLTAWLQTDRSVDVMIAGHVACAGLGAALLARELGASRAGAATAAFTYGTSGFVLSMAGYLNLLAGAGGLPLCIAGLRRFAANPRPTQLALAVAGTAAMALAGDPQALMVGGALALALSWETAGWRGAARATMSGITGLLIAGVQLVPAAAHIDRTDRAAGAVSAMPMAWSLAPWRVPELALPGLAWGTDPYIDQVFGALVGPGHWPEWNAPTPFAASIYVGIVPLVFAAAGVWAGRRGRVLGVLALALLWVALGPTLGADTILGNVPVWRSFRYAEKLVGPMTLVLAVLVGLGLDVVVEHRVRGWLVLGSAAALGLAAIGACRLGVSGLEPYLASAADARIVRGSWHILGSLVALAGWLLLRQRMRAAWAGISLAALVWCALAAASPAALRPGDAAVRLVSRGPELTAAAPGPRIITPYRNVPIALEPGTDRIDQVAQSHGLLGYAAYNVGSRLDSLSEYAAMLPRRLALVSSLYADQWPLAARRFGVTHVVVNQPQSAAQMADYRIATFGARLVATPGPNEIWSVPHREWASFAPEVWAVENESTALMAMGAAFEHRSEAVMVEASGDFAAAQGRILSVERGLESLRIEAETAEASTLVVADAWWPGWVATIDGSVVPIWPADVLVRAVRWPAGRHVLEMHYRPPELGYGRWISAVGLAITAAGVALLRRRSRAP